ASQAPGGSGGAARTEADAVVERVLSSLWSAIASGDLLRAELETATCMAIPHVAGQRDPGETETFISTVLVDGAVRRRTPEGAALLRMLMALGTQDTKRAASRALAELTGAGVYPPDWVTEIGKVTPGQAWRRYDVFGDDEAIAVTFGYGEAEHGIVVQVDLAGIPVASAIGASSNAPRLIEAIRGDSEEFDRSEQISLAEARRRLLGPLDRADRDLSPDLSAGSLAYLPIARSRVRRLPADDTGNSGVSGVSGVSGTSGSRPLYTAADRAAAVDEFMKSPPAAGAVATAGIFGEESTRFWAEVLTGYSGRVPGEPPAQVGPRKLAHILLGHVPNTFVLSPAQRSHLEPAVTAWVRWSAERRDLGEAATAVLEEQVPRVLSRFGQAYDDPDAVAIRGYASGLAASDADVSWLSDNVGRRMFALPMPERHAPLDLADPADRRRLVEAEFSECTPPSGLTSEEFVEAACRVVEELWRDEESPTFQAASRMFAEGAARHDIIHRLAVR
ncbi:MAG: hypothetical protein ACRDOH_32930, partial [Streptosporangiaceae bacterium]